MSFRADRFVGIKKLLEEILNLATSELCHKMSTFSVHEYALPRRMHTSHEIPDRSQQRCLYRNQGRLVRGFLEPHRVSSRQPSPAPSVFILYPRVTASITTRPPPLLGWRCNVFNQQTQNTCCTFHNYLPFHSSTFTTFIKNVYT